MNCRQSYLMLSFVVLLGSCSSVVVDHDYDHLAPFSQFARFTLQEAGDHGASDPHYDSAVIDVHIARSILAHLKEKGLHFQSDARESDLAVRYSYTVRSMMDLYNTSSQMGFSYQSYDRHGGIGSRTCTDISEFDQGILVIDIKNIRTGKVVWRGTGADIVSVSESPQQHEAQVEKIVAAVLRDFPPQK